MSSKEQLPKPKMEASSSSASGSADSPNGLKFGKKIYFEDSPTAAGESSSFKQPPPAKAEAAAEVVAAVGGRRGKGAAAQPPRCQVEGCKVDLTGLKAYYCRHKVCAMHSKSPRVVVSGVEQRFCQQCSRFHQLSEFDQGKRSCRRRLAGHNERRRKPPPGPLSTHYGRLASSFHEDQNRFRGFLMDFQYPRPPPATARDIWPTVRPNQNHSWQSSLTLNPTTPTASGPHHYPPNLFYPLDPLPPDDCLTGVTIADSSCALSLLSTGSRHVAPPSPPPPHMIAASSNFTANTVAAQSVNMSGYEASSSSWGFRGNNSHQHGGRGGSGEIEFSGELELALQGSGTHLDHGPSRGFDQCSHGMNWSL